MCSWWCTQETDAGCEPAVVGGGGVGGGGGGGGLKGLAHRWWIVRSAGGQADVQQSTRTRRPSVLVSEMPSLLSCQANERRV